MLPADISKVHTGQRCIIFQFRQRRGNYLSPDLRQAIGPGRNVIQSHHPRGVYIHRSPIVTPLLHALQGYNVFSIIIIIIIIIILIIIISRLHLFSKW